MTTVMRSSCHFMDTYIEEWVTVKSQLSLLDLTLETTIPDDVMWPFMDGKHNVSIPHHDGFLVDRVDDGLIVLAFGGVAWLVLLFGVTWLEQYY